MSSQIMMHLIVAIGSLTVASAFPAASRSQPSADVAGVVIQGDGSPIRDVEVVLFADDRSSSRLGATRTGVNGGFTLNRPPNAHLTLRFRRLGYSQLIITVGDSVSESYSLRITMVLAAVHLAPVNVESREPEGLKRFRERRHSSGAGYFIERAEIERRHPSYASDILRSYAGVVVRRGRIGNIVRVRGCKPGIWIDGVQAVAADSMTW